MASAQENNEARAAKVSAKLARRTLLILTAVYGINNVDRQILGILVQPIKRDLGLSDTQLGLLTGLAFALFYAGLGLPVARLAERIGRKRVISGSVGIFALATALGATVASFAQLFLARMAVGIGEAGTTPASLSIIADLYPEKRRTGAMAVFTSGALIGLLFGFAIAGLVATRFGWRAAFLVSGIPGLVLAAMVALFVVDLRPVTIGTKPVWPMLAQVATERSFWWLCLCGALPLFTSAAMTSWMPAYVQRAFKVEAAFVGLLFGVGIGVLGTGITLFTGWLSDRLHSASNFGPLGIAGAGLLLAAGCYLGALSSASLVGLVIFLLPALGLSTVFQAPLLARVQGLAPPGERATITAIYMFVTSLLGLALGPLLVGAVSDHVGHGSPDGLRVGLMLALLANLAALPCLWLLAQSTQSSPDDAGSG